MSILLILVSYTTVFAKHSKVYEFDNKHELVIPLIKGELTPILLKGDLTSDNNALNNAVDVFVVPGNLLTSTLTFYLADANGNPTTITGTQFCLPSLTGISIPNTANGTISTTGVYSFTRISDENGVACSTLSNTCGIGGIGFNPDNGRISHAISQAGVYIMKRTYPDGNYETVTITINAKPDATITQSNQIIYSGSSKTITGVVTTPVTGTSYTVTIRETYGVISNIYTYTGTTTSTFDSNRGLIGTSTFTFTVSPTNTVTGTTINYTYQVIDLTSGGGTR